MSWLAQNWIWILLGIIVLAFLSRRRRFGGGRVTQHGYRNSGDDGSVHMHGDQSGGPVQPSPPSDVAIDPVTRQDVSVGAALTSIYQGRIYYFGSAESRQRFEASPAQYAREGLGRPLAPPERAENRSYRGRGGC